MLTLAIKRGEEVVTVTEHDHRDAMGLQRHVDIGLRLAPQRQYAPDASKALAAILDAAPEVSVRLAGVGSEGSRIHLTIAVTLGTLEDVKVASPSARTAVLVMQQIVDRLAAYDPCLVELPDPASPEARLAAQTQWRTPAPRKRAGDGLLALIG